MTSIRASCGLIGNEDVPFKYSKNLDVSNGTSSLLIDVYRLMFIQLRPWLLVITGYFNVIIHSINGVITDL